MTCMVYLCQVGVSVRTTQWETTVRCVQLVTTATLGTATLTTASHAPAPTRAPVSRSPGARSSVPSVRKGTGEIYVISVLTVTMATPRAGMALSDHVRGVCATRILIGMLLETVTGKLLILVP